MVGEGARSAQCDSVREFLLIHREGILHGLEVTSEIRFVLITSLKMNIYKKKVIFILIIEHNHEYGDDGSTNNIV